MNFFYPVSPAQTSPLCSTTKNDKNTPETGDETLRNAKEAQPKEVLEGEWRAAVGFMSQCRKDHLDTCKAYGSSSRLAQQTWRRFLAAEKESKEARARWEAG